MGRPLKHARVRPLPQPIPLSAWATHTVQLHGGSWDGRTVGVQRYMTWLAVPSTAPTLPTREQYALNPLTGRWEAIDQYHPKFLR